jgi:GNAT superfamily N-acetyltransferase
VPVEYAQDAWSFEDAGEAALPARARSALQVRRIAASALEGALLPSFAALLRDAVDGGALLGFLPPLDDDAARCYWTSLVTELHAGARILLAACEGSRVVGCGQLVLSQLPATVHRAELQKIAVASDRRGRGIGAMLISALHAAALRHGRSMLLLNTQRGSPAERLYKRFGYQEAGVVRGYMRGPRGERYDSVSMVREFDCC